VKLVNHQSRMAVGCGTLLADVEKYKNDSNDATFIKLVRTEEDVMNDDLDFHPAMSHQIFGDSETIFGYKDLKVKLLYHAGSLLTYLNMTYHEKVSPSLGITPDPVLKNVAEKLQEGHMSNLDEFIAKLPEQETFVPPGEKIDSYTHKDVEYEVYHGTINSPQLRSYHERMQTFVLWYIDAASFIDVDDERWHFYMLFEKKKGAISVQYNFVGYMTVYHYYAYPKQFRPRISQMLILPPFQRHGHGGQLIETVSKQYMDNPDAIDITVEDPSDEFIRCRDFIDCKNCMTLDEFSKEKLLAGYNEDMHKVALGKFKISKAQSRHVYEILRLRITDEKNEQMVRDYRLDVKNRLNIPYAKQARDLKKLKAHLSPEEFNAAMIGQSDEERMNQLEEHFRILEEEYKRVIERLDKIS